MKEVGKVLAWFVAMFLIFVGYNWILAGVSGLLGLGILVSMAVIYILLTTVIDRD